MSFRTNPGVPALKISRNEVFMYLIKADGPKNEAFISSEAVGGMQIEERIG